MKNFLVRTFCFVLCMLLIAIIGFILPATPRASKSLLFAKIKKDSLLVNVEKPRLVLVGGSNLSFGINSKLLKDSLLVNPINTGVHAGIGLKYMLDSTEPFVKEGDIIIVAPEYSQFYGNTFFGGEMLLRTVFDLNRNEVKRLSIEQISNISKSLFKYSFSKLKPTEYFNIKESDVYNVNSFNEYGDVYTHWTMESRKFSPDKYFSEPFNDHILKDLKEFEKKVKIKKATLLVTFPCYQLSSYNKNINKIKKVEEVLKSLDFYLLGDSKRYVMSEKMMFNTPYHLTKEGVDNRTKLLIEDLKKVILKLKRT
ncbi:hypothetical protein Q4Q34_07105 [Flavivirga abyssicola]|uniref:hypothetical protein n=1 Tax=Flavivirga abyssicola TaxID=3063533 RepID=UPI0026E05B41|nr:hypothetical protein [Flavivirga sp. MEBiC07777]WVK14796.1 hypothetical protein Q4Q34_07105 [Flavivirga sp. MEBiC07777]